MKIKYGKYVLAGVLAACVCLFAVFVAVRFTMSQKSSQDIVTASDGSAEDYSTNDSEPYATKPAPEKKDFEYSGVPSGKPQSPSNPSQSAAPDSGTVKSDEPAKIPKTEKSVSSAPGSQYSQLMKKAFDTYSGTLSYELHMYGSGERCSAGSGKQKSASIIKLFIMEYAFSLMQKGELSPDDLIGGTKLSSLIESMITVSDNNATNTLIDKLGMDKINAYIKSQGYTNTILQRKMLDTAAAARGEENYTSASDVMKFLDKLYAGQNSYPMSEMLSVMKRQRISTKLRRNMPSGIEMASKTGELSDTENDAAIVFTPNGDYAIVCMAEGGNTYVAKEAMGTLCKEVYDSLG